MDGKGAPTTRGLQYFHDALLQAYGPQRWWPSRDAEHPRFEVLVGAVLTQHTAWTNVELAIANLRAAGPLAPEAILAQDDLPALIRRAGPHHVKAERLRALCRWLLAHGGLSVLDGWQTPALRQDLRSVRGVGAETADAILLYAFGRPQFVADAYAFRIFERYGWWSGPRRYETLRQAVEAAGPRDAVFHNELHALIVAHARRRCHKRRPDCADCALRDHCDHGRAALQR